MKPHKHAELIKAWADNPNLNIQANCDVGEFGNWIDISHIQFFEMMHKNEWAFRIKPEPKPDWCMYLKRIDEHTWTEYLPTDNIQKGKVKLTFDGETGELKDAEVLK